MKKDEIPKAVQEMQADKRKNVKAFTIKYIIFFLVLLVITIVAIVITINPLNKQSEEISEIPEETNEEQIELTKKTAEDSKYAIKKYSETYNENSIKILNYIDIDGKVLLYENINDVPNGVKRIEFIQIDGLIDKNVQNKINEKLKSKSYSLKSQNVSSNVTANFSNVFSVSISGSTPNVDNIELTSLNIDLTTGNEIPFEKLFVSSAPINSYLTDALYKTLAWDIRAANTNEENWVIDFDMSKADTSEFEDKSIMLINNYNKAKKNGNIKFYFTPDSVTLYDLADEKIVKNSYLRNSITIDFKNILEELAIYKRYLTDTSIFENNNLYLKNIIVCTQPTLGYEKTLRNMFKILNYGKISDNIFMEDVIENFEIEGNEGYNKIVEYLQKKSNDTKTNLKLDSQTGMFFQRKYNIFKALNEKYYSVSMEEKKSTCNIDYFSNLAFKDYIDNKTQPSSGPTYYIFSDDAYTQSKYPNLNIKGNLIKNDDNYKLPQLFFSLDGKYLGEDEKVIKEMFK